MAPPARPRREEWHGRATVSARPAMQIDQGDPGAELAKNTDTEPIVAYMQYLTSPPREPGGTTTCRRDPRGDYAAKDAGWGAHLLKVERRPRESRSSMPREGPSSQCWSMLVRIVLQLGQSLCHRGVGVFPTAGLADEPLGRTAGGRRRLPARWYRSERATRPLPPLGHPLPVVLAPGAVIQTARKFDRSGPARRRGSPRRTLRVARFAT